MKQETYIHYLETVVLSLLADRGSGRIPCIETSDPSLQGTSFSPFCIRDEIAKQHEIRCRK